jgi:CheY-like chemotaxis protein
VANILIADDDPHILRVMSIWLQRHGYRVTHARNGKEALDVIALGNIDLLISDMNMPQVDGIQLARQVREGFDRDIPILMLTARCDQQDLNEKLSAYDIRVFPKPFLPSQLVAEIDRLLQPALPDGATAH